MYYDLAKPQKKIARRIMDKGLDNDYKKGLNLVSGFIESWKNGGLNNKDAYINYIKVLTGQIIPLPADITIKEDQGGWK